MIRIVAEAYMTFELTKDIIDMSKKYGILKQLIYDFEDAITAHYNDIFNKSKFNIKNITDKELVEFIDEGSFRGEVYDHFAKLLFNKLGVYHTYIKGWDDDFFFINFINIKFDSEDDLITILSENKELITEKFSTKLFEKII